MIPRGFPGERVIKMSCYFRYMKDEFAEAGIDVTDGNKKEIDRIIHELMGIGYKDCSQTWREVKQRLGDPQLRQELIAALRAKV